MAHLEIGPGTLIYTSDVEPQELIPAEGTPIDDSDDCPRRRIIPVKLRQQMKLLEDSDPTSSEEFDHSDETNSSRCSNTNDRVGCVTDKSNESQRRLLRPQDGSQSESQEDHYSKDLSENMNKNRKESDMSDQPMASQYSFIYGNTSPQIVDDKIEVDKPVQELYSYRKMGPFKYYNPGVPLPKEDVGNPSERKLGPREYRRLKLADNARKYGIEKFHEEMIASLENPETDIFLCGSQYPEVKMDSVNSSSANSSDAASESEDFTDCLKDFESDRQSNRKIDLINLSNIDTEIRRKFALSNFRRTDNEGNRKIDLGTLSKIHSKSDSEINRKIDVNKSDADNFNESYSTTEDEIDCKSFSQKERNSALKINKILRLQLKKRKRFRMKRIVRLKKSGTRNDCKSDSSENRDCYEDIEEFT